MRRSPRRGWLTILFGLFAALTLVGTTGPVGATGPAPFGSQVAATRVDFHEPARRVLVRSPTTATCRVCRLSFCVATVLQDGSDPANTLVQVWNGSSWNTMSVPAPSGQSSYELESAVLRVRDLLRGGRLRVCSDPAVDAVRRSSGTAAAGRAGVGVSLPSGSDSAELFGVSCTGPAWCMAIGCRNEHLHHLWLRHRRAVERISVVALIHAHRAQVDADGLIGVSCTTPTNCMAVGASAANHHPGRAAPSGIAGARVLEWSRAIRFRRAGAAGRCQVQRRRPACATLRLRFWPNSGTGPSWTVSPALAPAGATTRSSWPCRVRAADSAWRLASTWGRSSPRSRRSGAGAAGRRQSPPAVTLGWLIYSRGHQLHQPDLVHVRGRNGVQRTGRF